MTLSGVAQYKPSAIREFVAEGVRRTLLAGGYTPGQVISEMAIAGEFGISRGPVREALLTLASEGLLVHSPNRGFAVLEFSRQDLLHVQTVRLALEPLALAESRHYATETDLARLRGIRQELVNAFAAGRQFERVSAEIAFHQLIWQLSNNPWLVASLQRVMLASFTYGAAFQMARHDLTPALMDSIHQMYIDYTEGVSSLSAEECVRRHLGLEAAAT